MLLCYEHNNDSGVLSVYAAGVRIHLILAGHCESARYLLMEYFGEL